MSFTDAQRNTLRGLVDALRAMLSDDLTEALETLGINRDGSVAPESHLSDQRPDYAEARESRRLALRLLGLAAGAPATDAGKAQVDALVRSIAFTHLHRFVAFRMMESPERRVFKALVGPKRETGEVLRWLAEDAPEGLSDRWDLNRPGDRDALYLQFLQALCARLQPELGALFDPDDLATRIVPRRWKAVLDQLNDPAYADFWDADETLGWVYQYYTPKSLRDAARKASAAPRNPWELAFRNQFYTPDYVVRFLVDNTLGRLWLEMVPDSGLRGVCSTLLVAPDEPLPPRAPKDPKTLTLLDPACGSGHFLLYAFTLFEHIYADAWEHPTLGPPLRAEFGGDRKRFGAHIPRLIVQHNLHGVDIDRRAVQVASLSLWLRARKALPDHARAHPPVIERSGIVCAEPLPGNDSDYRDFRQRLAVREPTAARLLDRVRALLTRAGDLGSLLRVDEALAEIVQAERKIAQEQRLGQQLALMPGEVKPQQTWLDFRDARAEGFWRGIEDRILEHLGAYGAEAEGFEGAAQRLFAKDGVGALRYFDALRATYDVVVMNPPFGAPTPAGKPLLARDYPHSRQDLAACFVERALGWVPDGFVGVLSTDAGFYRRTLEPWRREVLLGRSTMEAMVHLGDNVLDSAIVRVAAYTLRHPQTAQRAARYLRVLGKADRLDRFRAALDAVRGGRVHAAVSVVPQEAFAPLPYKAFGYWCSDAVRRAFDDQTLQLRMAIDARLGGHGSDDFRWLRLRWEVAETPTGRYDWLSYAKGGDYSPFHDDIHLLVCWDSSQQSYWGFTGRPGRSAIVPESADRYGRPGLTYPLRTTKPFAPRILPAGCAFGHKGPALFVQHAPAPTGPVTAEDAAEGALEARRFALLGLLNTRYFQHLLTLGIGMSAAEGDTAANSYEVGLLQRMPLPPAALDDGALAAAARTAWAARREADEHDETAAAFVLPFLRPASLDEMVEARRQRAQAAADRYDAALAVMEARALVHYGFDAAVEAEVARFVGPRHTLAVPGAATLRVQLAKDILSWALGVALGRFDVRCATGQRPWPAAPPPFAPVPRVSPGMHPPGAPWDAALVDDDGIVVDEPGHPDDVMRRVDAVLDRVWGDEAPALRRDLATALSLKGDDPLRGWFARMAGAGFWDDHRKRYSKSKREAPVYVPLRSPEGRWLAWVSFHRLTRQTLYALLGDRYVKAWAQRLDAQHAALTAQKAGAKLGGAHEDALAACTAARTDLSAFEARLREALTWRAREASGEATAVEFAPQHDDGVLVCLAPLHALIPWPPKGTKSGARTRLEAVWKELAAGKLDWSQTARRYFPARVEAGCQKHLSLAIAHGRADALHPGWRETLRGVAAAAGAQDAGDETDDEETDDEDEA